MYSIEQCQRFTHAIQAKVWAQDYTQCTESPLIYMNMWMQRTANLAWKSWEYSCRLDSSNYPVCFTCKHSHQKIRLRLTCYLCEFRFCSLPANKQAWLTYCFSMGIKYCLSPVIWKEYTPEVKLSSLEIGAFEL